MSALSEASGYLVQASSLVEVGGLQQCLTNLDQVVGLLSQTGNGAEQKFGGSVQQLREDLSRVVQQALLLRDNLAEGARTLASGTVLG